MSSISAIVPAHNRPELLVETINSLLLQTLRPDEIIIVDDGSTPPIDSKALTSKFGNTLKFIRNEKSHGLAFARNVGVEHAKGDYVIHLDDDDLFDEETLSTAHSLLSDEPDLDVIFIGVKGFGRNADHFNMVQENGVSRVCESGVKVNSNLIRFDSNNLITELLKTVPSAFQHVMTRKETWKKVTNLRLRAYQLNPDIGSMDAAKVNIDGPLRDSEWALYAAAICNKTLLINRPLYLARCEGQGYSSQPSNLERHLNQRIKIKRQFFKASIALKELQPWADEIRNNLSKEYFDAAYFYGSERKKRKTAIIFLWKAFRINPSIKHLKLIIKILLPRKIKS